MAPKRNAAPTELAPKRLTYYEHHGRVARRDTVKHDEERLAIIRESLPRDVRTILDVGCGVGLITRPLGQTHDVVGFDFSREVHKNATEPRVCGLAPALPFKDACVDLVLATQIFEHLTDADLEAVARELVRVTRRYVLITTTFRENLREAMIPCPACGTVFNAYGHLRTFDNESLRRTIPRCRVRLERLYALARRYPRLFVAINQRLFGFWHYDLALLCTHCGHDVFPTGRRGLAHFSRLTNLMARWLPRPRRPARILMLFEKDTRTHAPLTPRHT